MTSIKISTGNHRTTDVTQSSGQERPSTEPSVQQERSTNQFASMSSGSGVRGKNAPDVNAFAEAGISKSALAGKSTVVTAANADAPVDVKAKAKECASVWDQLSQLQDAGVSCSGMRGLLQPFMKEHRLADMLAAEPSVLAEVDRRIAVAKDFIQKNAKP